MATVPPEMPTWLRGAVSRQGEGSRRARFSVDAWEHQLQQLSDVSLNLSALSGEIGRHEAVVLVGKALDEERVIDAFVVAMLWGHGPSGYGPARTRRILTGGLAGGQVEPTVIANLAEAARLTDSEDDGYASFFHLNNRSRGHCRGLGPSFFTKWLFAVSARGNPRSRHALPILDEVVRTGLRGVFEPNLRRAKTTDYTRFVRATRVWAEELSEGGRPVTAADVEEAIFDRVRGYENSRRWRPRQLEAVLN